MFIKLNVIDRNLSGIRVTQTIRASSVFTVIDLTTVPEDVRLHQFGEARSVVTTREALDQPVLSTDHASQIETALIDATDNELAHITDISTAADFPLPDAAATEGRVILDLETHPGGIAVTTN